MGEILYIRTDANASLGIGHVMRCATVAQEWERRGGRAVFLVADEEGAAAVRELGHDVLCLPGARYDNLEKELSGLLSLITDRKIKLLLLDSYYMTCHYMEELYKLTRLVYLGKFHEKAIPAHMVIDYTIQAIENSDLYARYDEMGTRKLLGCDYFPLRPEFLAEQEQDNRKPEDSNHLHILIMTGGTDPFHVAYELCRYLMDRKDFCLHIVVGTFHTDRERLKGISEEGDRVYVYENVKNMAQLMRRCDMAVSAGGITLYELCACGVPTVAYTFADNQLPAVEVFERRGILCLAGDIRGQEMSEWCLRIAGKLDELVQDEEARERMSDRMSKLVDGRGAQRIVNEIEGLILR